MPPFRPRPPSDRQPGIRQANDRQRSFGFNPRQQQRPGGFQPRMTPPPMGGTIGRPPMQGETGRSLGPAGGPVPPTMQRPESFTNLDMLGRPDLAFKYSHTDPGRKEKFYGDEEDASIRGTWRRTADARRANEMDEYGYLEGAPRQRTTFSEGSIDPYNFNEMYGGVYDDAIFRTVDPNTNRIEQFPMAEGIGSLQEQAAVDPSDWRTLETIMGAGGNPDDYMQSAGIMGAMPEERQMAKVYTNQDPGMIDKGYFWDDFTPGGEAINKAYNWMRSDKPLYGSDPQGLRNAIKNQLFEDEGMYREMFPRGILQDLPEDAFENLEDFQNQQPITII